MDTVYPQALFATPVSLSLVLVVTLIQVASLIFLAAAWYSFAKMMRRHAGFFEGMEGNEYRKNAEKTQRVFLWIYIISTVIITIITTYLFFFQPHIL
ncbi:MAG: hypothetical protein KBD00_00425 [Candidatus Peribacteraceae bacterium]|nr:hypothetical protein [Candidatus Peribacteraceae bacterium]